MELLQWMIERDDPKTRISRLFRHAQDRSQRIRVFCVQRLEMLGVDSLLSTLDCSEVICGLNGMMRGLSEDMEKSSFRLILSWIRNRIEIRAKEQGINLLRLTTNELHQLIAEVVFELSGGENWLMWRSFLSKHYSLLLVTSSNNSTVCQRNTVQKINCHQQESTV